MSGTCRAFVLAAGFGTRLKPLTAHLPKAMVPVCGVPMLDWSLAYVGRHGLGPAIVNAHHLADQVVAHVAAHHPGASVSVESPEILGTGGGLKRVEAELGDRFVVVNADVLTTINLKALIGCVPAGGAAMALRPHPDAERYGIVAADATGVISKVRDITTAKPHGIVRLDTHFTGIHAMHHAMLEDAEPGFSCIVRTAYKTRVPRRLVRGLRSDRTWLDVGDPSAYLAANLTVLRDEERFALDPLEHARWARLGERTTGRARAKVQTRGSFWVGAGARVGGGTVLEDSIVGAGAVVAPGTHLTRCVVHDGVRVPAGDHTDGVWFAGGWLPVEVQ